MDHRRKAALLEANLPLVFKFIRSKMHPDEVRRLGGAEDARQSLCIVFLDACDEAEKRGLAISTAFYKLARFRMNGLTAGCHLVKAPRVRAQKPQTLRKAIIAMGDPVGLPEEISAKPDADAGQMEKDDWLAFLHSRLREVLCEEDRVMLFQRFGIGSDRRMRHQDIADASPDGISRSGVQHRIKQALQCVREKAPELAELLGS